MKTTTRPVTSARKIITVLGATGAQGGGLVRAILADPEGGFGVRAVTRHPQSEKARELAALGAEVVAGDVDDAASLRRAFDGAHGAYCVTFYWDHGSAERELFQARAMADAARQAGVKHVVWSTLEDTRQRVPLNDDRMPTLHGRFKVPHLDAKGEANTYFISAGVPTTFLLTSFYWENFILFGMAPRPGPDGRLILTLPMGEKKLPGIAAEDIGHCAYGIFQRGTAMVGKTVGIAGQHLTGAEMAAAFSNTLGRPVIYQAIPHDVYRALGFPGAEELGNMFQYKHDFEADYCQARSIGHSLSLNPGLLGFRAWLAENKHRFAIAA